jgi:hypothetical protein
MTVRTLTLLAFLLATLNAVSLPVGQSWGVVSIAENETVTQNTFDWANASFPSTSLLATIGGDSTGWFSSLDGTTITIDGLNHSLKHARSDFGPDAFIGFDADSTMPTGVDCVFAGIYPASGCAASPAAIGETCAPGVLVALIDSPLSLVSDPGTSCIPPIQTTATWVVARASSDAGARPGNPGPAFDTSSFQTPFVLPLKASITGNIMTVTAKLEPEGGYMLGSGLGLILVSVGSRRLFGKRHTR